MLNINVHEIVKNISSSPRKNGLYNLFLKINNEVGLKLSLDKNQRDNNYKWQNKACEKGLGPETYGTIDNVEYGGKIWYGYFTEIVKVYSDYYNDDDFSFENFYYNTVDNLKSGLQEINFNPNDLHTDNVGIKNGNLVCIDFDQDFDMSLEIGHIYNYQTQYA